MLIETCYDEIYTILSDNGIQFAFPRANVYGPK